MVDIATTPNTLAAKPAHAKRGIVIREPALKKPLPKEVPTG